MTSFRIGFVRRLLVPRGRARLQNGQPLAEKFDLSKGAPQLGSELVDRVLGKGVGLLELLESP